MISKKILIIYPETYSTKIAVYLNSELVFLKNIKHTDKDFAGFKEVIDQKEWRRDLIWKQLKENEINVDLIEIVMALSGLIRPLKSGIYEINDRMIEDLRAGIMGKHAINLGGLIAADIADSLGKKAYIADPVIVDEMDEIAKVTGHPLFQKKSIFHALNHKYVARKFARSAHKKYEELNLIILHVGSEGISVGAHKNGKVIDVNNAFDGEGPFSISRTGSLPVGDVIKLCFSGKYTEEELLKLITEEGGYAAYLGTSDINEIDKRMLSGDETAIFYSDALAYQAAKEIGAMCAVLEGEVDALLLSGNIFNSERFIQNITKRVGNIAEINLYPSVNNFEALMMSGLSIMNGEAEVLEY
ncbi:MAG: butyrate kinase [Bacteroidales bacterium]|nr:butyrate kinase [Bacteroidales bacterium]